LRSDFPDAKIIAMSGGAFGGVLDLLPVAQKLGASAILHKPFTQKTMLQTIERALQSTPEAPASPGDA
ncbi:MAG: response regulator, partial [Chloroflexota bacterium]